MSDNEEVEVQYVRFEMRVVKRQMLPAVTDVFDLLVQWGLYDRVQESVWVLAFDAAKQLRRAKRISIAEVARGGYHSVDVSIPVTMKAIHQVGADRFWLVHNHPSGVVLPSREDIDLTKKVMTAANSNGLRMEDHLIIGPPDQVFSFREQGMIGLPEDPETVAASEVVQPVEIRHVEQ